MRQYFDSHTVQQIATHHNLGDVYFCVRTAQNTGKPIDVGYVYTAEGKELFCKRQPSNPGYYLCNDFENLIKE